MLDICISGAIGWTGSEIVRGVLAAPDLNLSSAVARNSVGQDVGTVIDDAIINSGQVLSIRLPGYTLSVESLFAQSGERLVIRHEAGSSAHPHVFGTLLGARRIGEITGLVHGLDKLLFSDV